MITIKSNSFTDYEKSVLFDLAQEVGAVFEALYCEKVNGQNSKCNHCATFDTNCEGCSFDPCATCEVRHLCYDINKAKEHAEKLLKEV